MSYTTVKQVNEMEANEPIEKFKGSVKTAFMPNTGISKRYNTPWKVQSAILVDEAGDEIRASFWDAKIDLRDLIGNDVELESGKDGRGKFSGMVAEDYEDKKGVTTRQIKASKHTSIDEVVGDIVNGDYTESKKPVTASEVTSSNGKAPQTNKYVDLEHEKRVSFERQKALEAAVTYGLDLDPEALIEVAEKFYGFLNGNG